MNKKPDDIKLKYIRTTGLAIQVHDDSCMEIVLDGKRSYMHDLLEQHLGTTWDESKCTVEVKAAKGIIQFKKINNNELQTKKEITN